MDNYKKQLALLYFKTSGAEYELTELRKLLGLENSQLDQLLIELKMDGFISIENYLIAITQKGLINIVSNNIGIDSNINMEYNYKNIDIENRMPLNEPYVPKKFLTKL